MLFSYADDQVYRIFAFQSVIYDGSSSWTYNWLHFTVYYDLVFNFDWSSTEFCILDFSLGLNIFVDVG